MPDIAFVNGRFCALADAVVSVEDRGFQFGDGIYEVIRTYGGRPFELDAHLARLDQSARALDLTQPYPPQRWKEYILEGIKLAGYHHAKVYLQVTRGAVPRDHVCPPDIEPTVVMTIRELSPLSASPCVSGVEAMTMEDIRWGRCDIKSVNLLANVLARQQAKKARVFEAILVKNGDVTEGAVSNVMAVLGGTVVTAPEGPRILSGVTRSVVLQLARQRGLQLKQRYLSLDELYGAEEVFLTGTTVEVLGVVRIDGKTIGNGKPGPVTRALAEGFADKTN